MAIRLVLAAVVFAAGCSTESSPASPTSAPWAGRWNIVSIQASEGTQPAPSGVPYQITFVGDQVVSVRVDCNTCSGALSRSGNRLTIAGLACTRAACATAAYEASVLSLMTGEHAARVSGSTLWLESSRGVIQLSR
jgi:heat shock protein HslJ